MSDPNLPIPINWDSKPICKLIDAVQSGIGKLYEPIEIKRKAKAEAEAKIIHAKADVKVKEITSRMEKRIKHRELRRQKNIDAVIGGAIESLPGSVDEKPVNEDWVVQFFNLAQDVSDEEMQTLWSKLLAGEVTRPGSYSLRTLYLVKTLNKEDAQLFSRYCTYVWKRKDRLIYRFRTDILDEFLAKEGITSLAINHLENLGLVSANKEFLLPIRKDNPLEVSYFDRKYLLQVTLPRGGLRHFSGEYSEIWIEMLTDIGAELWPISGTKFNEQYEKLVIESLKECEIIAVPG
jgi:hypothetical protein